VLACNVDILPVMGQAVEGWLRPSHKEIIVNPFDIVEAEQYEDSHEYPDLRVSLPKGPNLREA